MACDTRHSKRHSRRGVDSAVEMVSGAVMGGRRNVMTDSWARFVNDSGGRVGYQRLHAERGKRGCGSAGPPACWLGRTGKEQRSGPATEAGAGENTWASSGHAGKVVRARPATGPKRERERAVTRFFFPFSTSYFKTNFNYESNQVHILFPIYFSNQIKCEILVSFPKINFTTF